MRRNNVNITHLPHTFSRDPQTIATKSRPLPHRMGPKRTLSFHGEFWQGFIKLSIKHQATAAVVATVLTFGPIALLTWALITYAQERAKDPSACMQPLVNEDRKLTVGFIGNSDFYGLGIRLGIYLQWLASLIANPLLRGERASLAGAYLIFSLALAVAVLLLAFRRECAFTAEIIVILNIFWGGTLLVMVPFVQLLADIRTTGLALALIPLVLSMLPVSTWFWLRLALYGEVDFVQTNGGTSFFLLARVTPNHLQGVSFLMAAVCLILCVIPVFCCLCLCLVLFLDWVGRRPPEWRPAEEEKSAKEKMLDRFERMRQQWTKVEKKKKSPNKWVIMIAGISLASWSILAVELTLMWNSVKGVYNVQSTGQIIALVIGLGVLVKVLWLLRHGKIED